MLGAGPGVERGGGSTGVENSACEGWGWGMEIEHPGRGPVDVGAMPVDILMVRTGGDVGLGIGRWGRGLGPSLCRH